jgi:indole-3-glycerol phosphate synthase
MAKYLDAIMAAARKRASNDPRNAAARLAAVTPRVPTVGHALRNGQTIAVIAEIKKKSPSKGWLNQDLDVVATAHLYEQAGARAISVLTHFEGFGGTLDDLQAVHATTRLPLLRKDFTVSVNDVVDAHEAGAAAILLIVAALSDQELAELAAAANACGLDALFEVHDAHEVPRAIEAGATIVGVNQRNLVTFDVDPTRARAVAELIPASCVRICESGLRTVADIRDAAAAGFDAVLIGEALVTDASTAVTLADFSSVAKRSDRG